MSARKQRPALGTPVSEGMSLRDMGAALGMSTGMMSRCMRLTKLDDAEFERRLEAHQEHGRRTGRNGITAEAILRGPAPVPSPGRVARALGIYRAMSRREQREFLAFIEAVPALEATANDAAEEQ